jgi:hypothetical protein
LQVQDQQTDGNQKNVVNNSLKYLCEGLKQNDIAAFSYDKRMFAQISLELLMRLLFHLKILSMMRKPFLPISKPKKNTIIIIAGHMKDLLIGMIAANNADAFISIAGPGRTIDAVVVEQIEKQVFLKEEVLKILKY